MIPKKAVVTFPQQTRVEEKLKIDRLSKGREGADDVREGESDDVTMIMGFFLSELQRSAMRDLFFVAHSKAMFFRDEIE